MKRFEFTIGNSDYQLILKELKGLDVYKNDSPLVDSVFSFEFCGINDQITVFLL
ncbi:hypothetical protein [Haloplasma contractile]|uniref:Uncharacterized protein n=1 Tax=Haloplasma contractile SSD-17B TaxID=1033810 RepID=U2FLT2_9MOLU|nr:hypothetical protein [Haloplasma contractile]ERJ13705.1 hypothetical protein HLPCO_000371 [Haloplasma contractile SSD-17B]